MAPSKEEALRRAIRGLSRPLAELVEDGVRLGWKPALSPNGVLILNSPGLLDEHEVIPVPRNERNVRATVLRTFHRKLRRYGDQSKMTDLDRQHLGEIPEEEEKETALEPKPKPGMPTAPPPDRPVETVHLPTPNDMAMTMREEFLASPDYEERVAEQQAGLAEAERLPVIAAEADGPVNQEGPEVVCEDCDPPTTWPSKRSLASHRAIHAGKQVRRKSRKLKCRYPGCGRMFYGLNAGFQRGSHEFRQHGRRDGKFPDTADVITREEPMAQSDPGATMPAAEALKMIVDALREAGAIESHDQEVAQLREDLAASNTALERAIRQRDDALEQLNTIKKAFKSLGS